MGGMPSVLSSQQPGKDAARPREQGEKSPASSPRKMVTGEIGFRYDFVNIADVVAPCLSF